MIKELMIRTQGEVQLDNGREFTRLVGGFGEDKPMFTVWQAGELLGLETKSIRENYVNNIKNFEYGLDVLDLKLALDDNDSEQYIDIASVVNVLKNMGYSQNKLNATKEWLAFSYSGMMKLVKIATTKESWNIYDSFLEDYFKTKVENKVLGEIVESRVEAIERRLDEIKQRRIIINGTISLEQDEDKVLELLAEGNKLIDEEMELKVEKETMDLKTALFNQKSLDKSKRKYINQTDMGEHFNLKIGANTIGKLLRAVGLAMKSSKKRTRPYDKYCPKYAQNILDKENNTVGYKWNYEECVRFIDRWLYNNDHYSEFYTIDNKNDMIEFVNILHALYVE